MPELELGRGEYYWHEVIGVTVRGVDGTDLGTVRDIYRIGENEVFSVEGGPFGAFDLPAVRAFVRVFAPRRGEIVVDAESLDLRPPRVRVPDPDRPKAPRRTTRRPKSATAQRRSSRRSRRRPRPSRPPRPSHDPRDRHPDALPGDARGPAQRQHPGPHPGAGAGHGPDPRPARLGPGSPPVGRRRPVRRGSGDGAAARAGRGGPRRAPAPGLDRDPARPGRRGLPTGACGGARGAVRI